MTIRGLVKKELKRLGYPIEISHYHKGRITWQKYVDSEGIELGLKYWIDDDYNYYVYESDDCEVYTKINMEV